MSIRFTACAFLVLISASKCGAQSMVRHGVLADSTLVFGSLNQPPHAGLNQQTFSNSMGADLIISSSGFGLGVVYRHEYADDFSGFLDFSISESKDDDERDYVDYYGRVFTPGKINRFLVMPLFVGVQQRLFKDDILDNFRPFITGAVGPTMIYIFPFDEDYFSALGHGSPKYTIGGYVGAGAYFGSERSNLLGLNLRYYFIPYPAGIASMELGGAILSKTQFGGVSVSLTFGGAW